MAACGISVEIVTLCADVYVPEGTLNPGAPSVLAGVVNPALAPVLNPPQPERPISNTPRTAIRCIRMLTIRSVKVGPAFITGPRIRSAGPRSMPYSVLDRFDHNKL